MSTNQERQAYAEAARARIAVLPEQVRFELEQSYRRVQLTSESVLPHYGWGCGW